MADPKAARPNPATNGPRKKPRRARTAVFLITALIAVLGAAFLNQHWADLEADLDRQSLRFERFWRLAATKSGNTLPGTPDLARLDERLAAAGQKVGDPIFMRIFKREFELELWMRRDGRFHRFATYPICRYSGQLGPKQKQGDRQAPEGIYTVSSSQLNPNSRWHRSFNLGFPNQFDRAHGRTGTFLMVHGGCSSIGCYAMTNAVVDEIWKLVTAALSGGQRRFQVQVFPFRMTDENLAARKDNRWSDYWAQLKVGHDEFASTGVPPRVSVCDKRYQFAPGRSDTASASPIIRSCMSQARVAETDGRKPLSTNLKQ